MRVSSPDDLLRFSPRIAVSVQKGKRPPVTRSALFFFLVPGQLPPGPAALVPFRGQAHPFYNIPKKLQYFPRYPTPPTHVTAQGFPDPGRLPDRNGPGLCLCGSRPRHPQSAHPPPLRGGPDQPYGEGVGIEGACEAAVAQLHVGDERGGGEAAGCRGWAAKPTAPKPPSCPRCRAPLPSPRGSPVCTPFLGT